MPVVYDIWRDQLASELVGNDAETNFRAWLEGYSLPPLDSSTEGHTWLMEAAGESDELKDSFAHFAANLLNLYFQNKLKSARLNRLLFNLFYLCAGLRKPDFLWQPLLDIFAAEAVPAKDVAANKGHYQGVALVTAFRAALTQNQADDRFLQIWRDMLNGEPHVFLRGAPMDGFEGFLGLPGEPDKNLIGWALARMADDIQESQFREKQFLHLIERIRTKFKKEKWNFLLLAVLCGWKHWAVKLMGDPQTVLGIEYDNTIEDLVYLGANRVKIPEHFRSYAADLEPIIRQLFVDFHEIGPAIRKTNPLPKDIAEALDQHLSVPEQRIKYVVSEMNATCRSLAANRSYNRYRAIA